ncbi:putative lipid II flippase FtsW [Campylobacterota bacterium]|nr:putative lipid II flippase FtsW [Campylobacterota bacterium]GHV03099.1 putative lipid II flippase FtsW [Campylobacterota bacterium]
MSDRYLFFSVALLMFGGMIFSLSLPLYLTQQLGVSQFHFFIRQSAAAVIALGLMWFIARQEAAKFLKPFGFALFLGCFALLIIMPFMPESIVPTINGARRWVRLGVINISPIEFFKVGFVYFLAWSLARKIYQPKATEGLVFTYAKELGMLVPYLLLFMLAVFLIGVVQNDLGQIVVLACAMALMIFFAGSSFKLFFSILAVSFVLAIALIFQTQHRIERVMQWWLSTQDFILSLFPTWVENALRIDAIDANPAYQVTQSLHAIHHGGLFGTGLGGGIVKLGFLSDVHNDFVLSGVAEETGLVGILLVSLLFLLVVYRTFKIANRSNDPVYYLFSIGIGVMLAAQFLMNALGTAGVIPLKGITAPFLSYGGASLVASSLAVSLVLMISKEARL